MLPGGCAPSCAYFNVIPPLPCCQLLPTPGSPTPARSLLLGGDYFLGAVIAATFTKLVLRLRELRALPAVMLNRVAADLMLYIVGILRLGESPAATNPVDADSVDRIAGEGREGWGMRLSVCWVDAWEGECVSCVICGCGGELLALGLDGVM